jgi:hypothetical protein
MLKESATVTGRSILSVGRAAALPRMGEVMRFKGLMPGVAGRRNVFHLFLPVDGKNVIKIRRTQSSQGVAW